MSKFAYRDKDRKHKVYADQVNNIVDNQKEFYCPNIKSSSDKKGNKYTRTTMTKPYQIYFPK